MFCILLHYRGHAGEYRFSALSGPKCPKNLYSGPAPPTLLNYCFSEEVTNVVFLPTIQRQHMICIPLHCRGRAGEYRFSALSGAKKMFQNQYSPASPAQHPQPCCPAPPTLLVCFSEEVTNVGFLPTIQTQRMICISLHCRERARSTGFQHFQAPNVPKPVLPRVPGPA